MKVKQIVGEHKKGVRAMKYTKKPVNPSNIHAKAKEKLQPVKPMEETIEVKPLPGASQVVGDGGKIIATTDAATAATIKTAAEKGQFNPTDGTETPVPETQEEKVGGDPTDQFIDDVTDHDFEKQVGEGPETPYFVDVSSGKPMAKTGGRGLTAIVPSTKWNAITPEIAAKAESQGFRKVMLQWNRQEVPGLEGGDPQLGSKIIVAPQDYKSMSTPGASSMRRGMGISSAEKTGSWGDVVPPTMKESDDALLEKMRTIAGLR